MANLLSKRNKQVLALILFVFPFCLYSQKEEWEKLFSFSFFENRGYDVLKRICDEAGGRLAGSIANEKAIKLLIEEGKKDHLDIHLEQFTIPSWYRMSDTIEIVEPYRAIARSVALGFNNPARIENEEVVFAKHGYKEDYDGIDVNGKVVIVLQQRIKNKEELFRYEAIDIAKKEGAKAILFVNDKTGGLVLAGVGNFQGKPNSIPAFSITNEEGERIIRLIQSGVKPKIRVISNSFCKEVNASNLIFRIDGKSQRKIVIGGHFDSWDISQGAIDNGVGIAVLYEVARNLARFKEKLQRTIEIVWFNGEELGLWGSKRYVERHSNEIDCMVNLDMTGTPLGFNAMGFDDLIPLLKNIVDSLAGFDLREGVINSPWTNSDHMYFMFEGIPSITLTGFIEEEMYRHYHDYGDTFDKVKKQYLTETSAITSILAFELANYSGNFNRLTKEEIMHILQNYNLEKRLKKQNEWPFD